MGRPTEKLAVHSNMPFACSIDALMPSLQCSPAELMLGSSYTNTDPGSDVVTPTTVEQVGIHQPMSTATPGWLCTHGRTQHGVRALIDRRLLAKSQGKLSSAGQLVQVYRNDLTYTFKKLSANCYHVGHHPGELSSETETHYHLETLEGVPIPSTSFSFDCVAFSPDRYELHSNRRHSKHNYKLLWRKRNETI